MIKIDCHQHFWKYHPVKDSWITADMSKIQRDFLPQDLKPILQQNDIEGCVAVQADQSEDETLFLLDLAHNNDFIKGVVGWVDLCSPDIKSRLDFFSKYIKLKGFRHIVQAEPEDDFLLREDFCNGIAQLSEYNYTYDILIYPKHLPFVIEFVNKFPNQKFVIDHLAKPNFKSQDFSDWEKGMRELALNPNVYCKVSGLVTEADWKYWSENDFTYCLDLVTEIFETNRLMFGSDWPVSLLAATYKESFSIVENYFSKFSKEGQDQFWGESAIEFYKL